MPVVCFHRLPKPDDAYWRAHLADAVHIGGTGKTPEEAIGCMLLRNPGRCSITSFDWLDQPPKLSIGEEYPQGPT